MMPDCEKSGYGVFTADNKYLVFDAAGNEQAAAAQRSIQKERQSEGQSQGRRRWRNNQGCEPEAAMKRPPDWRSLMVHLATMRLSRRPAPPLALALLAALLVQTAVMSQSPPKIDVSKLGPQVGERVPDFSLKDQNGKPWTVQSIMGPKGAMLVFYRSADW